MDGIFGHHGSPQSDEKVVSDLHSMLADVCRNASSRNIQNLYQALRDSSILDVIAPLIERIVEDQTLDADRLHEIALWFATKAPDREPVKFSLALLGHIQGCDNSDIFLTLGKHDEFTLYASVALAKNDAYDEDMLWRLAIAAQGWGRIDAVERLAKTSNPKIKDWLLREGYKNGIMYEYLACICARTGELHLALEHMGDDSELFNAAVELIDTLISGEGGPAEGLPDYEHGCSAIHRLLTLGDSNFSSMSHFRFLWALKARVDKHVSGERVLKQDWTDRGAEVIAKKVEDLLSKPEWKDAVLDALQTGDRSSFWDASRVSEKLNIDPWPYFMERTKAGEDHWFDLMRTSGASRIDDVLALAARKIPLDKIATGPERDLGLGSKYAAHSALDFVLQDLGNFPGKGWDFVKAGLRSPVIRNRHLAVNALAEWGRDNWPSDATETVDDAIAAEPEEDLKDDMKRILAGQELD